MHAFALPKPPAGFPTGPASRRRKSPSPRPKAPRPPTCRKSRRVRPSHSRVPEPRMRIMRVRRSRAADVHHAVSIRQIHLAGKRFGPDIRTLRVVSLRNTVYDPRAILVGRGDVKRLTKKWNKVAAVVFPGKARHPKYDL